MADVVSDMFSRLKNGISRRKETVEIQHSALSQEVARILLEEGFITKHEVLTRGKKKLLRIGLKYVYDRFGKPVRGVITDIKRVSQPSRRIYMGFREIPRVRSGFGCVILTTPQGVMSDSTARKQKVGGEILGYVW
ncbi:MAG TPA: 30S ribosomal protein S8 [Candidatus Omnitrophota bacterium]|nr:30S ribosomal protein S8 [Candidatus Omnitrophota bacterium]